MAKLAELGIVATGKGPEDEGQYRPLFERYSAEAGIDLNFLMAVGEHESGFDNSAVGKDGERGLMQIMPDVAREAGIDPTNPDQAIRYAARRLADSKTKYGSYEKALWEYNAGQGNLERGILPKSTSQVYIPSVMNIYNKRSRLSGGAGGQLAGAPADGEATSNLPQTILDSGAYPYNPRKASYATRGRLTELGVVQAQPPMDGSKLASLGVSPQKLSGVEGLLASFGRGFAYPLTPFVKAKWGTEVRPQDFDADVTMGERATTFMGELFSFYVLAKPIGFAMEIVAPTTRLGLGLRTTGGKQAVAKIGPFLSKNAVTFGTWMGLHDIEPSGTRGEQAAQFGKGFAEGVALDLGIGLAGRTAASGARRLFKRNALPEMVKAASEPITVQSKLRIAMKEAWEGMNQVKRDAALDMEVRGKVLPATTSKLLDYQARISRMADGLFDYERANGGPTEQGKALLDWTFEQQVGLQRFGVQPGKGAVAVTPKAKLPAVVPSKPEHPWTEQELRDTDPDALDFETVVEPGVKEFEARGMTHGVTRQPLEMRIQGLLPTQTQMLAARVKDLEVESGKLQKLEQLIVKQEQLAAEGKASKVTASVMKHADDQRERVTYLAELIDASKREGTLAGGYRAAAQRVIRRLERAQTGEEVKLLSDEADRLRRAYEEARVPRADHAVSAVVEAARSVSPGGLGIVRTRDLEGVAESFFKRQQQIGKELVWATRKTAEGTEVLFGAKSALLGGERVGVKSLPLSSKKLAEFRQTGLFRGMVVDYNGQPMEVMTLPNAKGMVRLRPPGSKASKFGAEGTVQAHNASLSRPLFPSMNDALPQQDEMLLKEFSTHFNKGRKPNETPGDRVFRELKEELNRRTGKIRGAPELFLGQKVRYEALKTEFAPVLRSTYKLTAEDAIMAVAADLVNFTRQSAREAGIIITPRVGRRADLQLAGFALEHGAVLDLDRSLAVYARGEKFGVELGEARKLLTKRFGNKAFVSMHSHPHGTLFSSTDFRGSANEVADGELTSTEVLVWPDGTYYMIDSRNVDELTLRRIAKELESMFRGLREYINMRDPMFNEQYNSRALEIIKDNGQKVETGKLPEKLIYTLAGALGINLTFKRREDA